MFEQVSGLKSNFAILISHLRIGGKAARTGAIRLPNNVCIRARNAADTADIDLVCLNTSDFITMGGLVIPSSSTYTPTLGGVTNTNVAATTAKPCLYTRNGNIVTVFGSMLLDPTLAATDTRLSISLPVASNLGVVDDCAGHGARQAGTAADTQVVFIYGDVTNDVAEMQLYPISAASLFVFFSFTYKVI